MGEMVSVRFPAAVAAAVRRIARCRGTTVSAWIRDTVAAEVERRDHEPVDVSRYPQTQTVASGVGSVTIWNPCAATTRTGLW